MSIRSILIGNLITCGIMPHVSASVGKVKREIHKTVIYSAPQILIGPQWQRILSCKIQMKSLIRSKSDILSERMKVSTKRLKTTGRQVRCA